MEPATAALIARAAIAAGTNKKVWTGSASVLAALCLPVILAVMCYISIASGGTEHNRAAVHLAFDGGEAPDGMPADYLAYVRQMQESFAELDAVLDDIDGMTEGELCDRYLVKSVFYSLYFGVDRVRLETDDYKKFADCFVDYEERTQNVEQEDGTVTLEKYTVAVAIGDKTLWTTPVCRSMWRTAYCAWMWSYRSDWCICEVAGSHPHIRRIPSPSATTTES